MPIAVPMICAFFFGPAAADGEADAPVAGDGARVRAADAENDGQPTMQATELRDGEVDRRRTDAAAEVRRVAEKHTEDRLGAGGKQLDPHSADVAVVLGDHVPEEARVRGVAVRGPGVGARARQVVGHDGRPAIDGRQVDGRHRPE